MAIKFLRIESETPNIQNTDDCRALRYAFGGRDGVVKSYLNVCSYTATSGVFKINSGEIVVQGCQVDIDANGIESTITSLSGTQYYICYLMLNLQTETASIVCSYATSDYPTIPTSDDLTANPTGTAYLLLYKFTASSGTISDVVQQFSILETNIIDNAAHATIADYASSDTSKGSIETRLTNLGFSSASFSGGVCQRQGNYTICLIAILGSQSINMSTGIATLPTIPAGYRPKTTEYQTLVGFEMSMGFSSSSVTYNGVSGYGKLTVYPNGTCTISKIYCRSPLVDSSVANAKIQVKNINYAYITSTVYAKLGWENNPRT